MHPIFRLGLLLIHLREVEGRKKFQKLVHILQVMGGPFPERFALNYFGAYSSDLRTELDAFITEDLIVESPTTAGPAGEFTAYTLTPTAKLKGLLNELPTLPAMPWLAWADELNKKSPKELEGISTILFLVQHQWPVADWEPKFKALKPHLSDRFSQFKSEAENCLKLKSEACITLG